MFDPQTTNEAIAETTAIQQSDLTDVPATTLPATSQITPEDTVTISATAADLAQPTATQVLLLYSEGSLQLGNCKGLMIAGTSWRSS